MLNVEKIPSRIWLVLLIPYILCIEIFSVLPGYSENNTRIYWSVSNPSANALHLIVYAGLAWLLLRFLDARYPELPRPAVVTTLVGVSIGTANEVVQYFVPGRAAAFSDVLFNLAGILCGILVASWNFRQRPSTGPN